MNKIYIQYKERQLCFMDTDCHFASYNQLLHKNNYVHLNIKFILTSKIINLINEGFFHVSRYNE